MTDSETFFFQRWHYISVWHTERTVTVHWEGHIALADKSMHYRNAPPLSPPLHVQSGGFVMTDLVIKWESCWVSYNASIPPASPSPQTHTHTRCSVTVRFQVFWDFEVVVIYISVVFVLAIQNYTWFSQYLTFKIAWKGDFSPPFSSQSNYYFEQTFLWSRLKYIQ